MPTDEKLSKSTLLEQLDALVREQFTSEFLSTHVLRHETLIKDVLYDSLDAVEFIMAIEDHFIVEIADDEAEKFQTFGDVIDWLADHKKPTVVRVPRPDTPPPITGQGYRPKSSVSVTLDAKQREMYHKLGGSKWLRQYLSSRIEMLK